VSHEKSKLTLSSWNRNITINNQCRVIYMSHYEAEKTIELRMVEQVPSAAGNQKL
jgi:hypothetical protein